MPPHKRRQYISPHQTPKPWPWLIAGLLIGASIVLLPMLQDWFFWAEKNGNNHPIIQNNAQAKETVSTEQPPPHFEFYTLLPEMEAAVSEPKLPPSHQQPKLPPKESAEPTPKPQPSPSKSLPPEAYVIQAGSFRSYSQADKRKADLALMGVEAAIQTVTIDNSKTWHRVRVGPSTNLAKLRQIRQQLRENQIECQLFKVKS
ncbi:SPOR domain-containing protein [Nitrosococcus oceani]|uniref:SPOR domain-containing protein n=1 Tax=Nitrosococcus oceani TaxID=1229 RepID=UPI0004E88FD7|nr:SPOR domain-containing protein [Nitrosococcus oceani]KFI24084.1 sporulation protein [Nitrosococcus oceani]